MIVDLVRHNLYTVCRLKNVSVLRLTVAEGYASVFQVITVVEGQIPQGQVGKEGRGRGMYTVIDVLATNLPPRSIAGAPKKRSCEILQEMEEYKDKSLYSGVVGYMDFGGSGDFSVNIWCMFKWADEGEEDGACEDMELDDNVKQDIEVWNIGAGGAVTALSTSAAEREEMEMKLSGILGVSGISPGK